MKKLLIALALMLALISPLSSVAYAYNNNLYEQAVEATKDERTDEYAIDAYKYGAYWDDPLYVKWANKITAGITNDYDKAKAISGWVYANTRYAYYDSAEGSIGFRKFEEYGYMRLTCVGYAHVTHSLLNAAGIPAKTIIGGAGDANGWEGHEWNRAYVDNRWIHVDSCWGEFDTPVSEWSQDHTVGAITLNRLDEDAWNGSLYFYDSTNRKMLKEVKNFPLNGVVKSTYGFDIKDLYLDTDFTEPFKLNTLKVNTLTALIIVKRPLEVEIVFDSMGGTAVAVQVVEPDDWGTVQIKAPKNPTKTGYKFAGWYREGMSYTVNFNEDYFNVPGETLYAKWVKDTSTAKTYKVTFNSNKGSAVKAITTTAKSTIKKPTNPTRKGYKFVAWYKDSALKNKWNFSKDTVTKNTTLYAGWVKTYTVTFNSNKGTSVKSVTATNKSTISKPTNPTRKGYKFVAWYKDAKCTKKWDFSKDKVTAATTLYAGWKK